MGYLRGMFSGAQPRLMERFQYVLRGGIRGTQKGRPDGVKKKRRLKILIILLLCAENAVFVWDGLCKVLNLFQREAGGLAFVFVFRPNTSGSRCQNLGGGFRFESFFKNRGSLFRH